MIKKIAWQYPHLLFMNGGTKFLYEVFKRIPKKYQIEILTSGGAPEVAEKFSELGTGITYTSITSSHTTAYWLLFPFMMMLEYIKSAPSFKKADYMFASSFPSNVICAVYTFFHRKPYYYYCYEPGFVQNRALIRSLPLKKRLTSTFLAIMYGWTDSWATKKAHKIFTLNKVTQKMIKKTYGRNSIVTLMGVDTNHFKPHLKNKIKTEFKNNILITHSTDYTDLKRTDLAIRTIAKLAGTYPQLRLVITSTHPDIPEKKRYEDLAGKLKIKKNILFRGFVSYDDLPLYYGASLCYLSCSYDEMLGTTSSNLPVKEALACETPAIRAHITNEDVEDGRSGFLVDPRNIDQVASKIEYLIRHPDKAKTMGRIGRKKIILLYKWDAVSNIIVKSL